MTRIESLWQSIRKEAAESRINEGECRLVRIDTQHPFEIYSGVDGAGSVMLAVCVNLRPPAIDANTNALNYIRTQRAGGAWLMALCLASPDLEQVFGRLCQDLIDVAVHMPTEAALVTLFRERFLLWKRLFQDSSSGLLQKFQIKGLIAELLELERIIDHNQTDPCIALISWVGPSGADQDFMFADGAIEVKSVSPSAEKVNITSAMQLNTEVPLELHLYILRESSSAEMDAINLPILVNRIEQRFSQQPDALKIYRSKLIEAGYVEHDYYLGVSFTLMELRRYNVCENFPRLIKSELHYALTDITYSIVLTSIAQFQIPEKPNAA